MIRSQRKSGLARREDGVQQSTMVNAGFTDSVDIIGCKQVVRYDIAPRAVGLVARFLGAYLDWM